MQLLDYFKPKLELVVIRNALAPEAGDIEVYHGDDLQDLLQQSFGTANLPTGVRLYHGDFSHEVTPTTPADVDKLLKLHGRIYAVVTPMLGLAITAGIFYLGYKAVSWLMGQMIPPVPSMSGNQPPSPNNSLAQRTNRQRLGGRVPDIFGEVWATPDLLSPPYSVYVNHREVEYSYLCVGRGFYNVEKALDDTTPIDQIHGACAMVFDPDKNVWDDSPTFQFGNSLTADEVTFANLAVKRYTSVNGQTINASNDYVSSSLRFDAPNIIASSDTDTDFSQRFTAGQTIKIDNAATIKSANGLTGSDGKPLTYNLNGTYTIASVTATQLTLTDPATVAGDWTKLTANSDTTDSVTLSVEVDKGTPWLGWFYTDEVEHDDILINVKAPNGLYQSKAEEWAPLDVLFEVESELVDSSYNAIAGTNALKQFTLQSPNADKHRDGNKWLGSTDDKVRQTAAMSVFLNNPAMQQGKRLRWRIRRVTDQKTKKGLSFVQDVKLIDFLGVRAMAGRDTPKGVTTVYTKTLATEGALSLKERKLKLLVERYVKNWQDGDKLFLSKQADDIIYHIATDPVIGNMIPAQIDMPQIKGEYDVLRQYFGHSQCSEFCHTFDDNNSSSEETLQAVATTTFCQLYRFDNKIRAYFERPQNVGVAIFNSHNILPDTYTRSESFGVNKDFDGVTVKYTDPKDDAQISAYFPADKSAVNPDEKTLLGVRNSLQADTHMMRLWHKHLYSYKSVEFTGADESNIVMRSQRIDVADQMRADVWQGVVTDLHTQGGDIVLSLSNPVDLTDGTVFIQMINGQVDSMAVTVLDKFNLKLPRLPMHTISTDVQNVVQCAYQIVAPDKTKRDAYVVTGKSPDAGFANKITAINYDERYYAGDNIKKVQNGG